MHTYKTNKTLHGYINISILISNTTILPVSLQKPQKMWSPALSTDLKVRVQHVSLGDGTVEGSMAFQQMGHRKRPVLDWPLTV